jgi:hypothetical protein
VHDTGHAGISGATVSGYWENGTPASCVTDGTGSCLVIRSPIHRTTASVTFTVSDVSHASYTYVQEDSDGTLDITVMKP